MECLNDGGIIIYPTDTIYGMGCDIFNKKAIEKLCRIKNIPVKKAQFSFICSDLSHLSLYTKSISTPVFRILKRNLPGPFTFILPASREVPDLVMSNKKTVGIRVPNHPICQELLRAFGHPIISTSLPEHEDVEYYTNPYYIHSIYEHQVDLVIDSGIGHLDKSTIIQWINNEFDILRQGKGEILY